MIDVTSLENAVVQLEEAIAYVGSDIARADPRLARHLRAAAIQAFEFTYELAYRTLRRFLAEIESSPAEVDALDFSGSIRLGYARGLLDEEISAWRDFRKNRSITSHTYDEDKAQAIFVALPRFVAEVRRLLTHIRERQGQQ